MGDSVMNKEFPDQKQRAAVCYQRYGDKKAQASQVVTVGDEEYLFMKPVFIIPDSLKDKFKEGSYRVLATFHSGEKRLGYVSKGEFEADIDDLDPDDQILNVCEEETA